MIELFTFISVTSVDKCVEGVASLGVVVLSALYTAGMVFVARGVFVQTRARARAR